MIASGDCNHSLVDLYPIVVALDDDTLANGRDSTTSLYNSVASEASWFASERSWRLDEDHGQVENFRRESGNEDFGSPTRRGRKFGAHFLHKTPPSSPSRDYNMGSRKDCDNGFGCKDESTPVGGAFANMRSRLKLGCHRSTRQGSLDGNTNGEKVDFSNVSPIQSPSRMGTKRNRPPCFHDEYVLTQQIVRCRIATLWECVHRPTGRRYCAKAIDKRRFSSRSDRTMAVKEINMHRLALQTSFPSCLPRTRAIFADAEAGESTQQHEECKSLASSCSESTRSVSSSSACDDSHWYIVQDFEAGGGNLGLYLLGRENSIFDLPVTRVTANGEDEMSEDTAFHALAEASRSSSRVMQESEVRCLARSLLLALNELHRRSICHNDLCPENILVPILPTNGHRDKENEGGSPWNQESDDCESYSYRHSRHRRRQSHNESSERYWEDLKLCDLGRSFFVNESRANATSHGNPIDEKLPRHSSIYYTSPEVIKGKHPRLASDMWSVGVILYRCFAGELPFQERSDSLQCTAPSSTLGHSSSYAVSSSSSTIPQAPPQSKMALQEQLKRDICRADCNLGQKNRRGTDLRWSRVSRGAKQFLSALLNPSSSGRISCDEALRHPWLANHVSPKDISIDPPSSSSTSLSITPIVASTTSTNHYRHHPSFSTTANSMMNQGDNSCENDQEEGSVHRKQESSQATPYPVENAANESTQSVLRRPKSLAHKLFGRLKVTNEEKNLHETRVAAQMVID